jgi:putative ABC transport system permease protein
MFRAALRLLVDQPSKSVGTLLGVVVSTFLMAQQISTLLGILARVAAFVDGTDVDVWITSPTTVDTDITDSVPITAQAAAASTEGVAWAAPIVQGMTRAVRPDGERELVKVVGVEGPRHAGLPRTLAGGTRGADLAAPGRVLISAAEAPLFGPATRGDRLEIGGRTLIVAGFFDGVDPHGNYSYAYTTLADARAITGLPEGRATFIAVGVAPGHAAGAVAARLAARIPDARVFTRGELRRAVVGFFMQRTPVGLVFGLGTTVAALVGALIVGVTMFSSVVDRTRDLGTLLAIGARRRDLLALLLAQALIFFAAGATLGLLAFALVKAHARGAPMVAPAWMLAAVAAGSLLSCLLASLAAIRRVWAIDPALVFRA